MCSRLNLSKGSPQRSVNLRVSGTDKTGLMKTRAELTRKKKKICSEARLLGPVMAGS